MTLGSSVSEQYWYKDAVIYELHIKAFFDSNGDGIGDFNGLLQKLDYLQLLGVTAIWVLPFYPSPLRDDGYDIADYYSINSRYGNLDQFKRFLSEAHKKGLKVITELVINHTSDQHPWFKRSRVAAANSEERNFYVWTDDPTNYKDVRIIFQDFEHSNWTWDPVAQQYYWHRFFHHQPDLNFDNEAVQQEIFKMIDYWCALGVDGFRLDAIPYLFEREGTNGENLPETHAFLKRLRSYIDAKYPSTCFLAEANMWPEDSASYFGDGDECHMNYNFPIMPRMFMALQREDRFPITDIIDQTPAIPDNCQWAIFLRNHDELTLEMVTDEERDYMYKVYAKDPKAKINLGIRHRLAPLMDNDRRKIELMNCLLFALPGTPVIYYGDEIGMGDNVYLGDRDGVRTPMQWSPDRNAGFSTTNPQRLYLPVISDPQYHYESVNVETQLANTSSLLWFMKRIIAMRKKYKSFSQGSIKFLNVHNPKILCFVRSYLNEVVLVVVNLSKHAQPAEIPLEEFAGYVPVEVFSRNRFPAIKKDIPYFFTLGRHAYQWFELEPAATEVVKDATLPHINLVNWEDVGSADKRAALERTVLPAYLQKVHWASLAKNALEVTIKQATALPVTDESDAMLFLIEVIPDSGFATYYHLPIYFVDTEVGQSIQQSQPNALLASATLGSTPGFIVDGTYELLFQKKLLQNLLANKRYMASGEVLFISANNLPTPNYDEALSARVHEAGNHTILTFGNQYFIKIYRRVEPGLNPDVELTQLLSGIAPGNTPPYAGNITWQLGEASYTLALLEPLLENHGTGEDFLKDRVANFIERVLVQQSTSAVLPFAMTGTLTNPLNYDAIPEPEKLFIGGGAAEFIRMAANRLAQIHVALAGKDGFSTEEFSLHYQRSLYSSLQGYVREMDAAIEAGANALPESVLLLRLKKQALLDRLKRIYVKKLDVLKTRIHGSFELKHLLLTGKDVVVNSFEGTATQSFSELRLKRSPLKDVASFIMSVFSVTYTSFLAQGQTLNADRELLNYAGYWAQTISRIFLYEYQQGVQGKNFIPLFPEHYSMLLQTFLLEAAIRRLTASASGDTEKAVAFSGIIEQILNELE